MSWSPLFSVLFSLPGLLFLVNGLAPLVIWRLIKIPARVQFSPLAADTFFADRNPTFCYLDQQLRQLDLVYVTASHFKNGRDQSYFAIYSHRASKTVVTLIQTGSGIQCFHYVELSRRDRSGKLIGVHNSPQFSAYPRLPDLKVGLHYPQEWDPGLLWQRLDRLQDRLNFEPAPLEEAEDWYLQIVAEFIAQEADVLVQRGYCREAVNDQGQRSLTLKGAYLMTWCFIFPGQLLKMVGEARYARRLVG